MQVIRTVQAMIKERAKWTDQVGFVPTMGYLHAGHLSLCRQARADNHWLVVSIFVNPTQFAPHEDFNHYPRDLEHDLYLLEAQGVDAVFIPDRAQMYPPDFVCSVDLHGPLTEQAEGAARPGHFRGVATIVLKLLQIIQPHSAYFGQKDAQQVAVISRMVSDFHLAVQLHILPIIREIDGLAMSSRNSYLDTASRVAASVLYRALQAGQTVFNAHSSETTVQQVNQAMLDMIATEPGVQLAYAEVRHPATFQPLETLHKPALLLIAASVNAVRLIDNFLVRIDGTWETGQLASNTLTML